MVELQCPVSRQETGTLIVCLAPSARPARTFRVVVGGDLAAAGEILLDPLAASLRRGAVRSAADDVTVLDGALGDRAEVLGAVALVLRRGARLLRR